MEKKTLEMQVSAKTVYGNQLFYPENEVANRITALLKTKTFTVAQLKQIHEIGVEVTVVAKPITF